MKKYQWLWLALLFLALTAHAAASPIDGAYAVVVSKATQDDSEWAKVVQTLVGKYQAEVIVYDTDAAQALGPLRKVYPRYACFVARPEEASRDFVVRVHRLTRVLDGDPYTDLLWGILTGDDAEAALRIAAAKEPLVIRKGAAGTSLDLKLFDEGIWYSEGEKGVCFEKKPGREVEKKSCPADSTKSLVDTLNEFQPDLFVTSGHATDRDWQIGFSYPNGQFRCLDGVLMGVDLGNKTYPIRSSNPKVYLASGNCLMGLIRDRQSMALAWMNSGGANQMIGYVVSTWYGRGGWGTRDWLFEEPGRYTLSEAFFLNNQRIVHDLQRRFPAAADQHVTDYDDFGGPPALAKVLADIRRAKGEGEERDCLGLLWDRDTVAFYGDPAWQARLAPRDLPYDRQLTIQHGEYHFELRAKADCRPALPPSLLLPHRLRDVEVLQGQEFQPLIADNFIMLLNAGELKKGASSRVVFKARRIVD